MVCPEAEVFRQHSAPFRPQDQVSARSSRDLQCPRVTDPEAPPIRPEPTSQLDRDGAQTAHRRSRQDPPEMPLLQCATGKMAIPDY